MNGKWSVENFKKYDEENPNIYGMFKEFALEASRYRKRYSAKNIFHRMRWETMIRKPKEDFKIDDGWISHYARKFLEEYPNLEGFFETRVRRNTYHKEEL